MILRSSFQLFSFCLFLVVVQSNTEAKSSDFGGGLSIVGLVLLAVSIIIYVLEKPKVKYVEFESFEVEGHKKSNAFNTEVKLSLQNQQNQSHKSIPPAQSAQDTNNHSTSIDRKKRKRKVDRLQALSKKESATDIKGEGDKQFRDSCIEVE